MQRREFLALAGGACGTMALPVGLRVQDLGRNVSDKENLYNFNFQTALGLGDERASIINYRGEFRSRRALLRWVFPDGEIKQPTQQLYRGYLPIVQNTWERPKGTARARAYASQWYEHKGDFVDLLSVPERMEIQVFFPCTEPLQLQGPRLLSGDDVLVQGLPTDSVSLLLSFEQGGKLPIYGVGIPRLKPFLNYGVEHSFKVTAGRSYMIYWAVAPTRPVAPGTCWFQWLVNDVGGIALPSSQSRQSPMLNRLNVIPEGDRVRIRCDPDPSVMAALDYSLEHSVWLFDEKVDETALIRGELDGKALAHIPWDGGIPSVLRIAYRAFHDESQSIFFPYNLAASTSLAAPRNTPLKLAEQHWDELLEGVARFDTGDSRLEHLFRSSLINILLLRTRYSGYGEHGEDMYVVKPGAGVYDSFWYRDGSYMITALDRAGLRAEAEKSLGLFFETSVRPPVSGWVQNASGAWEAPRSEWDGLGQAPWALVYHYQVTGDLDFLRRIYPSLRKGAKWIQRGTLSTREEGKSTHYGLIPAGFDEGVTFGYSYYLQRWALFGLDRILAAARILNESQDVIWLQETYNDFQANLLTSERHAFETTGKSEFLPITPDDPSLDLWGNYTLLYPTNHLSPNDPMAVNTLNHILSHCTAEDMPMQLNPPSMFLYVSIELAMCFLLQNRREIFSRIFNSYVAHVPRVNGWCEGLDVNSRIGSGDSPHGWAAAEFIHALRNSFVLENGDDLELAWGIQPEWLETGKQIGAHGAPTAFGVVDLTLSVNAHTLDVAYRRKPRSNQEQPRKTRLHLPRLRTPLKQVRLNGRLIPVEAETDVIEL